MELERVIAPLGPVEVARRAPAEVLDLAHDARTVTPGTLFFCVRGSRADGHHHAHAAVERGAVALVVERELDVAVPQVVVDDVRVAMAPVAAEFFGHPSRQLDVVGVTGTNGKTTTTFLLYSILDAAGRRPGLLGNVERRVGDERRPATLNTPEAPDLQRTLRDMVDRGNRSCVMEASSHGAVQRRLDCLRFAALVFTNLTQDHLDFHGDMETYFAAKRALFAAGVPAAVNVGDPYGRRLAAELEDALTFGLTGDAEIGLEALADVDFRLPGRFNVENALAAVAGARLLGVEERAIAAGLEAVRAVPGRFERVDERQPFGVFVDYAHTPDSLRNALEAARDLAKGRVICVFGCGGDRDRAKRPLMGRVAADLADVAVVTSDNPRTEDPSAIVDEVVAGAPPGSLEVQLDRRRAIEQALEAAAPGDVVLIAGKGHEGGQEIHGVVYPFDDREVARQALRALVAS